MTPEMRKRLTEDLLGECWHTEKSDGRCANYCPQCGLDLEKCSQRTFSTPDDAQVVKDKLVEKGLWLKFLSWMSRNKDIGSIDDDNYPSLGAWSVDELFSYTRDSAGNITGYRLCDLAGEFLEAGL